MATDLYSFPTKEMRDLAYETEIARGTRGVTKFTDSVDGKIVYVLAVPVGVKITRTGRKSNIEREVEQEIALNAMENEGGQDAVQE